MLKQGLCLLGELLCKQLYILTENCPILQSKSIPLTTMNGFYPFLINDKYVYKTRSDY